MLQIELKRALVARLFSPELGWSVTVDLDAMELGKGPHGTDHKRTVAHECLTWFVKHQVVLMPHPLFGRTDIVASHPRAGTYVIEVEGESRRQPEQALYSCLGQTLLSMRSFSPRLHYGIAVPDTSIWRTQLSKLPRTVRRRLGLHLFLVANDHVIHLTSSSPKSNSR